MKLKLKKRAVSPKVATKVKSAPASVTKKPRKAAPRKAAKAEVIKRAPRKRTPPVRIGAAVAEMSPRLQKLVARADKAEATIAAAQVQFQEALLKLKTALGTQSSFEHPERGYLIVMKRGDTYFWRAKPNGHR